MSYFRTFQRLSCFRGLFAQHVNASLLLCGGMESILGVTPRSGALPFITFALSPGRARAQGPIPKGVRSFYVLPPTRNWALDPGPNSKPGSYLDPGPWAAMYFRRHLFLGALLLAISRHCAAWQQSVFKFEVVCLGRVGSEAVCASRVKGGRGWGVVGLVLG